MEDSTYHVKTGPMMTDSSKGTNGLKQNWLSPFLFNIELEYVRRQLSVQVKPITLWEQKKVAISDVYDKLKVTAKGVGLNNVNKSKTNGTK
jgi:hypothetical protein